MYCESVEKGDGKRSAGHLAFEGRRNADRFPSPDVNGLPVRNKIVRHLLHTETACRHLACQDIVAIENLEEKDILKETCGMEIR